MTDETGQLSAGDWVRIVSSGDVMLNGQNGHVTSLPTEDHPAEYAVRLDGGIPRSVFLEGKVVSVRRSSLIKDVPTP